jgi:hypothetical protein
VGGTLGTEVSSRHREQRVQNIRTYRTKDKNYERLKIVIKVILCQLMRALGRGYKGKRFKETI